MSDLIDTVNQVKEVQDGVVNNKVANFAYTSDAYDKNIVDGVPAYDANVGQNIPLGEPNILKVNPTVLLRGFRANASAITRMLLNHFLGRTSYNLNKANDNIKALTDALKENLGSNVNFATLDATGRIPFSQLPESSVEYKGNWDASTNTTSVPYTTGDEEHSSLKNGWGNKGDFWICSKAGWFNPSTGESSETSVTGYIAFLVGDRIIYDGVSWSKSTSELISDNTVSEVTTWSSTKIKSTTDALNTRLTTAEGKISNQGTRLSTAEGNITSQGNRLTTAESKITTAENNIQSLNTNKQNKLYNHSLNVCCKTVHSRYGRVYIWFSLNKVVSFESRINSVIALSLLLQGQLHAVSGAYRTADEDEDDMTHPIASLTVAGSIEAGIASIVALCPVTVYKSSRPDEPFFEFASDFTASNNVASDWVIQDVVTAL